MLRTRFIPAIAILLTLWLYSCSSTKNAKSMIDPSILNGTWELTELTGALTSLDALYPNKKPSVQFDTPNQKISGHTGCNSFNGPLSVTGAKMDLSAPMAMTRMMCPGNGEKMFLDTFTGANGWTVREGELRLMKDDLMVMKFEKTSGHQ